MRECVVLGILVVILATLVPVQPINPDTRTKSGSGQLDEGDRLTRTMTVEQGDFMSGQFTATGGQLQLGVLLEDNYQNEVPLPIIACRIHAVGVHESFEFEVPLDGEWVFVLINDNAFSVEYSYSWSNTPEAEMMYMNWGPWITIGAIIGIVAAIILFIRKQRE